MLELGLGLTENEAENVTFVRVTQKNLGGILRLIFYVTAIFISSGVVLAQAPLPPCGERPTLTDPPWINGNDWCLEEVIADDSAGELGFTALAAAPDGTLYAARPLDGEILALRDMDGDGLPERPTVIAEGLTLPNGLAYFDEALYVSGANHIYRIPLPLNGEPPSSESVEILVDDVPAGAGFWTGGLTIADEHIYVAVGAACDFCETAEEGRGAIWRYELDGSGAELVASGLRQPGDVAWLNGTLWTLDSAHDAADGANLDELNRLEAGAHYGWPYCAGADNQPDLPSDTFDCASAVPPSLTFPTHSNPLGMAAYTDDTFPKIQDSLLVVLNGSYNQSWLEGFTLAAVLFDEAGRQPSSYRVILPEQTNPNIPPGLTLQDLHYQGSGVWPRRPIDVTVSAEGWIYLSVGGGRILALRPA